MSKKFNILSIDGGGIRGIYAAYLLKRIEEEYAIDWRNDFNLIAGTSTGSIIAAGLACEMKAKEISSLYTQYGKKIFKKKLFCRMGFFASKYKNKHLEKLLIEKFGNKKLGEIKNPLIIPSTDIGNGCVHVFKSGYDKGFLRDKNVLIKDAVLASCSAPTYFNPHSVDSYLLTDGGLWANNPTLIAIIEAKSRLNIEIDNIRILSIGTGISKRFYSQKKNWWNKVFGWGILTNWRITKLLDMLFNLQSETAKNMSGLLLDTKQILRINFESDKKLSLDDMKTMDDLKSKADHDFTHNSAQIKEFLKPKKI